MSRLLSLIFPRNCVGCGEPLTGAAARHQWEYLCADCACDIRAVGEESCRRCGVPVYGVVSGPKICSVCRATPPVWNEARSILRYRGPVRGWIRGFKYHDAQWVQREWIKLLAAPQFSWLEEFLCGSVLLPVPLHPLRQLIRGFNQSEELCRLFIKAAAPAGASIDCKILKRVRWTRQQARLGREDRLRNVKNAFEVHQPSIDTNSRLILVDDLLTTGATLTVCVLALRRAGFKRVDVLTLARG